MALLIANRVHAAGASMNPEWLYMQPITITGDNIDGDEPRYNQFCIAPATDRQNRKCYDPDDSNDGLLITKWDNNVLTVLPPADIPVYGIVTLKLRKSTEHCYGSAGCDNWMEDEEREIGQYRTKPYITEIVEVSTGQKALSLKPSTAYSLKGAFFGESNGSIFVQADRAFVPVDPKNITSWSSREIRFMTPSDVSPNYLSVNNGQIATQYEFKSKPTAGLGEMSSQASQSAPSASTLRSSQAEAALFADVGDNHPYRAAIAWAKQTGILQGYPDGTFQPERGVNRAEFLRIILGAEGIKKEVASTESGFKDVDEKAWYAPYVRYAKEKGYIEGYPDGTFRPDQKVTIPEALKMAYVVLAVPTTPVTGDWYARYVEHARMNDVLFSRNVDITAAMSRKDVVWVVWKLKTHSTEWAQTSNARGASNAPSKSSAVQFKDGTYVVGVDIQPGTYRTRVGSSHCYYSRLGGFSGEIHDVLDNAVTDYPAIVTILPSDKGFSSRNCGMWTSNLSAITTDKSSFGDGTFIVGTDIEPATYKSSGASGCYYARLSGFTGGLSEVIANQLSNTSAIVTISSADRGFTSRRCGTWQKVP